MPTTRSKDPLDHVLDVVLGSTSDTSPYRRAITLASVGSIEDLMDLHREDLVSLEWKEGTEIKKLSVRERNLILSIKPWLLCQDLQDDEAIYKLTAADLTMFHHSGPKPPAPKLPPPPPVTKLSAAEEFKKGIKRDMTAFKPFKEKKAWNPWYRNFEAIATAQGLGNVLDPTYSPCTADEKALFTVLQSYTFAVFTTHLVEPQASALVRKYSGDLAGPDKGNEQALHKELVKIMSSGITAQTMRSTIETKLTNLCLNNSWSRGIVAFLTHFAHLICDLHELRPANDTSSYNDQRCITTLNSALSTHAEMTLHVNLLATSHAALESVLSSSTNVNALTFDDYMVQLNDHAVILDDHANRNRQMRRANQANQDCGGGRGGGRGNGRGGGGGHGGNRDDPNASRDVTDPAVRLTDAQYAKLTGDQKRARYECKEAQKAQRQVLANAQALTNATQLVPVVPAPAPPVPASIAVNALTSDAPSVAATSAISTPVQPGTVLHSMMLAASARPPDATAASITINGDVYTPSQRNPRLPHP